MHYQEELKNAEGQPLVSADVLAAHCWNAYSESVGGKAWNGDTLPSWDEMKDDASKQGLVAAWKRGAFAAAYCYELHRVKAIIERGHATCGPNGNIVDSSGFPSSYEEFEARLQATQEAVRAQEREAHDYDGVDID